MNPSPSGNQNFKAPSSGNTIPTFTQTPQNIAKAEEIRKLYIKTLGRNVNDADLAYIINSGISESELTKRMLDSEEHMTIVKAHQEIIKIKAESENILKENKTMKIKVEDTEYVNNSLRSLLDEKTVSYNQFRDESERKDEIINRMQKDNSILLRRLKKMNEGFFMKLKNSIFKAST